MAANPDDTSRTKTKSHQTNESKARGGRHHGTRKNIIFPADAKLYNKARQQLTQVVKEQSITLRQAYEACHELMPKIGRYDHPKQYKRMKKPLNKSKVFLGRVLWDIDRQVKRQGLTLTQAGNSNNAAIESIYRDAPRSARQMIDWWFDTEGAVNALVVTDLNLAECQCRLGQFEQAIDTYSSLSLDLCKCQMSFAPSNPIVRVIARALKLIKKELLTLTQPYA